VLNSPHPLSARTTPDASAATKVEVDDLRDIA
jgi:hypothetical protein